MTTEFALLAPRFRDMIPVLFAFYDRTGPSGKAQCRGRTGLLLMHLGSQAVKTSIVDGMMSKQGDAFSR